MAASTDKLGTKSDVENVAENDDVLPELNVLSPDFNPLQALYSPSINLPVPGAPCFNNLSEYENITSGRGRGQSSGRGRGRGEMSASAENRKRARRRKDLKAKEAGLEDNPRKHTVMRNVLSRMSEQTEGPYSLLYACVQKRCKVRVCVRSFKGLRGICTGYLVAFDREMNMALSDVDEVYRIPSTGQRFYHEEKLTYSKILECSKIRPNRRGQRSADSSSQPNRRGQHSVDPSSQPNRRGQHSADSSSQPNRRGQHSGDSSSQLNRRGQHSGDSSSQPNRRGQHSGDSSSQHNIRGQHSVESSSQPRRPKVKQENVSKIEAEKSVNLKDLKDKESAAVGTYCSGKKDKMDEEDKRQVKTKDEGRRRQVKTEEEDEETLQLRLLSLKEELSQLSPDAGLVSDNAVDNVQGDVVEGHKLIVGGDHKPIVGGDKSSIDKSDDICKPMAFENQLMKCSNGKTHGGALPPQVPSHVRTNEGEMSSSREGLRIDSKTRPEEKGNVGTGKLRILPEDFKRRHVNQLFLRGDNVVLVSVDKALLGKQ